MSWSIFDPLGNLIGVIVDNDNDSSGFMPLLVLGGVFVAIWSVLWLLGSTIYTAIPAIFWPELAFFLFLFAVFKSDVDEDDATEKGITLLVDRSKNNWLSDPKYNENLRRIKKSSGVMRRQLLISKPPSVAPPFDTHGRTPRSHSTKTVPSPRYKLLKGTCIWFAITLCGQLFGAYLANHYNWAIEGSALRSVVLSTGFFSLIASIFGFWLASELATYD